MGPSTEDEQDHALAERISAHIDCINFATRDAYRARRGYLMRIDEKQGPTGSEKYDDAHPDEAAKVTSLSQFRNRASDLLKSGKALARVKRDGKKLAPTTTPELDLGQPANVLKAYNELIDASNGLDYR